MWELSEEESVCGRAHSRGSGGRHQKNFAFKFCSETNNVWSDDFKFCVCSSRPPSPLVECLAMIRFITVDELPV